MRSSALAWAGFVLALVTSAVVVLLGAAAAPWQGPLQPEQLRVLHGARFQPVFGAAKPSGQALAVTAAGEDFSALQAASLPKLPARDFPLLRYHFADFPRTLELSLVFRTAEDPDDVQTVSLPWPGSGTASVDLSRLPAWQGHLIEVGFAQFATAQNVPPSLGFQPFEMDRAELWSPSWRGSLAALATDWFAAWPWSQRSVHSLGRESGLAVAWPMVVCIALLVALAIVWAALLLRLRGTRLAWTVLICAGGGWLLLDLRWQIGLMERLALTRELYAQTGGVERERVVGDESLLQAAAELRELIDGEPAGTRLLIEAGTGYQSLRMVWHLLPLNVGTLPHALGQRQPIPDGSLIVFYDSDAWAVDSAMRQLLAHSQRLRPPDVVMAQGFEVEPLVVFRYRDEH